MAAADDRINADPLADGFVGNPFSDGVDNAKKFMANNARVFGKRIVAAINMAIGTAYPRQLNFYPHFARGRLRDRTIFNHQFVGLANHDTFHFDFLLYQFHNVPSSRRATGK